MSLGEWRGVPEVGAGGLAQRLGQLWHAGGGDRRGHVIEAASAHGKQAVQLDRQLVGGLGADAGDAPVVCQQLAVVETDDGLRVADVDG